MSQRKKTAKLLKTERRKVREIRNEVEAHEGLLKLAVEDMRKIYEDLLQSQARLQQADKLAAIGLIAAGVIHEINNPLGIVHGTLTILAQQADSLARILQAAADIDKEIAKGPSKNLDLALKAFSDMQTKLNTAYLARAIPGLVESSLKGLLHVSRIIGALKTFSRMDKGTMASEDLNKSIDDVIDIIWNQIKYKAVLKKEYGDIPPVMCSSQQLCQVFMNLLINASHAITASGEITVRTYADKTWVYAEVADNGSGIPPEVMPKIFDPFFTTKEAGKGTGLGLSICADIVRRHKGEMKVRSQVGEGTTFTVCLPRKA